MVEVANARPGLELHAATLKAELGRVDSEFADKRVLTTTIAAFHGLRYAERVGGRRTDNADHTPPDDLCAVRFTVDGEELMVLSWPATATTIEGLSAAESDVLKAALGGLTAAEIARERGRSVFTIQNQIVSALRRLGVTTRAEAAALLATARR